MSTPTTLYLLDKQLNPQKSFLVEDLMQIIMIKTNPCIFTLQFRDRAPLLLQFFRRAEIVNFLLTYNPNVKICRSKSIRVYMRGGGSKTISFDKVAEANTKNSKFWKQIEKNV